MYSRNQQPNYGGPQQPPRAPMPSHHHPQGGGGGGMAQRRPAPPPQGLRMKPVRSPDDTYTFKNLVAVSPRDIPPSRDGYDSYVLVNEQFVFSARPYNGFPQNSISMNDLQRTWAGISLIDEVIVRPFDPFSEGAGAYLDSMDMTIGFAGRKTTDTPYDQDELAKEVVRAFENQVLSPGQQMVMDVRGIKLKLTVAAVTLTIPGQGPDPNAPLRTDGGARAILIPNTVVAFSKDAQTGGSLNLKASKTRAPTNAPIKRDFNFEDLGIGGLSSEFGIIFRRAFGSRAMPQHIVERLGLQHVRGILLYGPPGTGKTLIARRIGQMLNAREPKVINGPEVLNKFVGQSEENIRKLFADAEKEFKEKGDESQLHIIIFDELDAVCRQRGSGASSGTNTGDTVVNQLLSKMDGVNQLNNILIIGMTNRLDMIDSALLRPGRFEVHVEISLPDANGRREILNVHTVTLRKSSTLDDDVDLDALVPMTKNFSGAELSGLVRSATSFAISRTKKSGMVEYDIENIKVNMSDFQNALTEIEPAFGVSEGDLGRCIEHGIIHFSPHIQSILDEGAAHVSMIQRGDVLTTLLLHGPSHSGKSSLAAQIALNSGAPFIKLISSQDMDGFNEYSKVQHIATTFSNAYKSRVSIVVIDQIERIIDWNPIGPRFSNLVVSSLLARLQQMPPKGHSLLVLATTSRYSAMSSLDMADAFKDQIAVPNVADAEQLWRVLESLNEMTVEDRKQAVGMVQELSSSKGRVDVGIKYVMDAIRKARVAEQGDHVSAFANHMAKKMID